MEFDNVDLSHYFKVKAIRGRDILPQNTIIRKNVPGKKGSKYIRKEKQEKPIEVDIVMIDESMKDLRATMRSLSPLLNKEQSKLRFNDELDKYYIATLETNEIEEILKIGKGTLVFIANDPDAYGVEQTYYIPGEIINNGTSDTKGEITINITSDTSYLRVALESTGEYIYIKHDFVVGDEVKIKFEDGIKDDEVLKNGYLIMADVYLESTFFSIPPGKHTIDIDPLQDGELTYIERWE